MGLGKTIQALALIISRPSDDSARKTNLIVAPVALMEQWKREIAKMIRSKHQLSVYILHGDTRLTPWHILKEKDIVLTTYGTIASELKRKHAWDLKVKTYPDARPSGREDHFSVLGERSKWYRVILDESQCIKNKATKAAIAASHIQSEYRWCMSGTPMQNNVAELYSLIHFLRIKPYNVAEKFSTDFTRPLGPRKPTEERERAMRHLQALLKAILLRRTKRSEINGKPILNLLPKTTHEQRAVFSDDEREFYKALEHQTQLTFNKYIRAGTVGRNYSNILVLLLRLRQACCHPHLIKDFAINTGGPANLDLIANAQDLPTEVVERLRETDAFDCPVCIDAVLNPLIFNPCGHSLCEDCFSRLQDATANPTNGDDPSDPKCPNCRAKINTLKLTDYTSFRRVFCQGAEGVEPLEDSESEGEETATDSDTDDDTDDDEDNDLEDFVVPDEDPVEYDTDNDNKKRYHIRQTPPEKSKITKVEDESKDKKKEKSKKKQGKGKAKAERSKTKSLAQLRKEGLKSKAAKKQYLRRLEKDWQTSAKIEKTMELLQTIHARGQGEKTIIFSGFTSFLDLMEVPISRKADYGSYTRYDGSMTTAERNNAVLKFTDDGNCTIMLVSLKAGNSGLNLTAASQVIILDPHWNGYVEAQAVDRAHRIGQMRPVEVHRVLIGKQGMQDALGEDATVEDRILELQERKRQLVESALDENAARSVARLGVRELGFLFVSVGL